MSFKNKKGSLISILISHLHLLLVVCDGFSLYATWWFCGQKQHVNKYLEQTNALHVFVVVVVYALLGVFVVVCFAWCVVYALLGVFVVVYALLFVLCMLCLVCLLLCMLCLVCCCVCRPGQGTITLFQSGATEPHGPKGRFTEHTTTTLSLPSFVTNDFIISRAKEVPNFKLSLGEFWTWTNLNKYRQCNERHILPWLNSKWFSP